MLGQAVLVEQNPDVAAGFGFFLGVADPRRFFQDDGLHVLILFERAIERRGVLPLVEHAADFRVAGGNVPRQRVRIEPVERLLRALVRVLHQVRQRHHRVPRRVRGHLYR